MKFSAYLLRLLAVAGLAALLQSTAMAHTALKQAAPANGALVRVAPSEIELEFNGPVTLVKFELMGAAHEMETEFKMVPEAKANFIVATPGIQAGDFTVNWSAMGADGHTVSNSFSFTVDPAATEDRAGTQSAGH